MAAAVLRRAGFAATIVTGLAMLAAAVHGVTHVDATLQLAAGAQPTFVVDTHAPREHAHLLGAWRACERGDRPGPRI